MKALYFIFGLVLGLVVAVMYFVNLMVRIAELFNDEEKEPQKHSRNGRINHVFYDYDRRKGM